LTLIIEQHVLLLIITWLLLLLFLCY